MTDLSIVIPTYDTASMTLRCCRAVLASMPASSEVIVSDDGSRDGTTELLAREVPEVRVVRLETNRGFAAAANHGVAAAQGRIILLLNSDAIVEAGALQTLLSAFDEDPQLGVAGAQLLHEDGTPQWSGGRTPTLAWMVGVVSGLGYLARFFRRRSHETTRRVDWVSGAAMAFRRVVWRPLKDHYLFYCQDIDFCLQAKRAGWSVRIIAEARVRHWLGGTKRQDHEYLYRDLLAWGKAYYGRAWYLLARPILGTIRAIRRIARGRAPAHRSRTD